ncbi:hypothetical protein VTO73DRAFT_237 [Trametes versicolor]
MYTILHRHISPLLLPLLCLSSLSGAAARLVNRTIDDENGDSVTGVKPVYAPSDNPSSLWTQGATCTTCNLAANTVIDVSQTVDGTWHDATYKGPANPPYTIDASFTGTAVYVYFIVPNFVPRTTTYVNLSFLIDDIFYNQYEHVPDPNSTTIMYNTLVFHTTDLVNTNHNIEVRASGSKQSVLLFDNMIYTVDEADQIPAALGSGSSIALVPASTNSPTQSPPSSLPGAVPKSQASPSVSAIAGGVAGGIAILSLVLGLYCCLRKRRHRDLMPSRWARKPQVPPHPAMTDAFDPPAAATLARPPLTHSTTSSPSEENTGGAGWSTIAYYSDIPILPQPPPRRLTSEGRGLDSTESKPAEAPSHDSLPSSGTHAESPRGGEPTIRALVTLLQEELESLREERQLDALYIEPPPHYEE